MEVGKNPEPKLTDPNVALLKTELQMITNVANDLLNLIKLKNSEITQLHIENGKLKYGMDDLWFEENWLEAYYDQEKCSYVIPDYYINRFRAVVTAQYNRIKELNESLVGRHSSGEERWK